jgi:hypothetical protein
MSWALAKKATKYDQSLQKATQNLIGPKKSINMIGPTNRNEI